jgi:hypothetical protein
MKVEKFKILKQDVGYSSCDGCSKSFEEADDYFELNFGYED